MFAPPCENLRILRCAREFRFGVSAWTTILNNAEFDADSCLSDKPWGSVWRITADLPTGPTPLIIKVHAARTPRDRIRSNLHLTRLRRQWRGSARLSRAGFPAARCQALITGFREGRRIDALVMDALPGRTLLDVLAAGDLPLAQERLLAKSLGRLLNGLWYAGLHSKDLKPSNLLVSNEHEHPNLTILDTDAVGHRPAHPLLPLVIEPSGLGVLPRRSALFRVAREWAWNAWLAGPDRFAPGEERPGRKMESRIARRAWREVADLVRQHGDATPTHDPIRGGAPLAQPASCG